ncbi:unnamed protein product, partial [Ilex paraguariensis]
GRRDRRRLHRAVRARTGADLAHAQRHRPVAHPVRQPARLSTVTWCRSWCSGWSPWRWCWRGTGTSRWSPSTGCTRTRSGSIRAGRGPAAGAARAGRRGGVAGGRDRAGRRRPDHPGATAYLLTDRMEPMLAVAVAVALRQLLRERLHRRVGRAQPRRRVRAGLPVRARHGVIARTGRRAGRSPRTPERPQPSSSTVSAPLPASARCTARVRPRGGTGTGPAATDRDQCLDPRRAEMVDPGQVEHDAPRGPHSSCRNTPSAAADVLSTAPRQHTTSRPPGRWNAVAHSAFVASRKVGTVLVPEVSGRGIVVTVTGVEAGGAAAGPHGGAIPPPHRATPTTLTCHADEMSPTSRQPERGTGPGRVRPGARLVSADADLAQLSADAVAGPGGLRAGVGLVGDRVAALGRGAAQDAEGTGQAVGRRRVLDRDLHAQHVDRDVVVADLDRHVDVVAVQAGDEALGVLVDLAAAVRGERHRAHGEQGAAEPATTIPAFFSTVCS